MNCFVYRSTKKADTYIYLLEKDGVSCLPAGLKKLLGVTEYVLELDLEKTQALANADIRQVISNLHAQGYYIQLPKEQHVRE